MAIDQLLNGCSTHLGFGYTKSIIMPQQSHYQFDVVMSCSGCSNAINKVLSRLEPEVSKIDISLENQTVDVVTTLPYDTILEKIKKTGKEVKSGKQL